MKKISAVMITGIFLVFTSVNAFPQNAIEAKASVIEPYHLGIAYFKTTNLMFPYAIKSVDRGSKDVLAQKAKGVENILQIKAGRKNFDETNLTVITADGKLYSYVLHYADDPSALNIRFGKGLDSDGPETFFSQAATNEADIHSNAVKVAGKERTVRWVKDKSYGMKLRLEGLYINDDIMYYQVLVRNRSNINYDIDQYRFFIRDQKKSKRTASQELELKPLYVYNDTATIAGQSERIFVFALPKFTIPDKKYLNIQVMEKNGGRYLELKVGNPAIIKSKPLNP